MTRFFAWLPALAIWLWASAAAAECLASGELEGAIDRLARGASKVERLKLGGDCLVGGSAGEKRSTLRVQVSAFPHSNGVKRPARNAGESQRATRAASALQATVEGSSLSLRAADPGALFITTKRIYTFRFELTFERVLATSAAASAGELEVAFETPCVSHIWLWSRDPTKEGRAKLSRKDGFAVEYRLVGDLNGRVVDTTLADPYYATFEWNPDTGGKKQRIHVTLDANGTRTFRLVELVNRCADGQLPSRKGAVLKLKVGYPLVGAGVGYRSEGPAGHYGVSLEYDYYLWDASSDEHVGTHLFGIDWRGGPEFGNGIAVAASVSGGVAMKQGNAALYYMPKLVFGRRGSGLGVGVGMLGIRDDHGHDITWMLSAEWGMMFGEDPSLAARPPDEPL